MKEFESFSFFINGMSYLVLWRRVYRTFPRIEMREVPHSDSIRRTFVAQKSNQGPEECSTWQSWFEPRLAAIRPPSIALPSAMPCNRCLPMLSPQVPVYMATPLGAAPLRSAEVEHPCMPAPFPCAPPHPSCRGLFVQEPTTEVIAVSTRRWIDEYRRRLFRRFQSSEPATRSVVPGSPRRYRRCCHHRRLLVRGESAFSTSRARARARNSDGRLGNAGARPNTWSRRFPSEKEEQCNSVAFLPRCSHEYALEIHYLFNVLLLPPLLLLQWHHASIAAASEAAHAASPFCLYYTDDEDRKKNEESPSVYKWSWRCMERSACVDIQPSAENYFPCLSNRHRMIQEEISGNPTEPSLAGVRAAPAADLYEWYRSDTVANRRYDR